MIDKLIDRIIVEKPLPLFNSLTSIKEKLDYYRQLSREGLSNLSDEDFIKVHQDITNFFNFQFLAYVDAYPTKLFRISFNKSINKTSGRGGVLKRVSDLLGPPAEFSTFNRCNLPGERIFYSAVDLNTAVIETKPTYLDVITISEWKIKEGQQLMMYGVFNHPDIIDKTKQAKDAYDGYLLEMDKAHPNNYELFDTIIRFVTEEFIKPVPKDKPKEYLFSAIFSSGIFRIPTNGVRMEAICYPSIQRKYGKSNIAIINSLVLPKFQLEAITTYDVLNQDYNIDPTTDEGILKVFRAFERITEFDIENDKIVYPTPEFQIQQAMERIMKRS